MSSTSLVSKRIKKRKRKTVGKLIASLLDDSTDDSSSSRQEEPNTETERHFVDVNNTWEGDQITYTATDQILNELRSLKTELQQREEANQNEMQILKQEVRALRNELRQWQSLPPIDETTDSTIADAAAAAAADITLLPVLPFGTLGNLQEFDEQLSYNDELRQQLKSFIQRVVGKDMPAFLRMAIRSIMADEVAVDLTWRGTNDKPSIQQFNSFNIIKEVCQNRYSAASVLNINKITQQHFLHAKDRVNKRQKKVLVNIKEIKKTEF